MQKGFEVVNLHGTASGVIAVPVIGENGNWWIGNEDTGIKAQGEPGPQGEKGEAGSPGVDPAELVALKTEVEELKSKLIALSNRSFMPGEDYIDITNGHVATTDGWAVITVGATQDGSCVNMTATPGISTIEIGFWNQSAGHCFLPVKKGSSITYSLVACKLMNFRFYPC